MQTSRPCIKFNFNYPERAVASPQPRLSRPPEETYSGPAAGNRAGTEHGRSPAITRRLMDRAVAESGARDRAGAALADLGLTNRTQIALLAHDVGLV